MNALHTSPGYIGAHAFEDHWRKRLGLHTSNAKWGVKRIRIGACRDGFTAVCFTLRSKEAYMLATPVDPLQLFVVLLDKVDHAKLWLS